MITVKHNAQVFWPVVQRVFVDMVDNLSAFQLPANHALCHNAMLVWPFSSLVNLDEHVHLPASVVKAFCPNRMNNASGIYSLSSFFCDTLARRLSLAIVASFGVMESISVGSSSAMNRASTELARFRNKLFGHAITYTNTYRSAMCLS